MPKNSVTDPITDQEMDFARHILSGKMSDQEAAEAAGLNPTTAAYTKAKPRVRAWMEQHRAATQKQILDQEAENLSRKNALRERVLERLWAVADLGPDQTRNNMASQMKALAMIVAIEGLIPDRRAATAQQPAPPAVSPNIYKSEWLQQQQNGRATASDQSQDPHPNHLDISDHEPAPEAPDPSPAPSPNPNPDHPTAHRTVTFAEANDSPYTSFVPDTRGSALFQRNPFARRP